MVGDEALRLVVSHLVAVRAQARLVDEQVGEVLRVVHSLARVIDCVLARRRVHAELDFIEAEREAEEREVSSLDHGHGFGSLAV